jgi:hypothetical protein
MVGTAKTLSWLLLLLLLLPSGLLPSSPPELPLH